jgi:non-ribosomal peptide synthetase component F
MGGGATVVISDAVRESPAQFWQQVKRDGVTFISCVPSFFESVLREATEDASLDHLALGGEAFTGEFRNEISRHLKVARITNLYGPTEATIDAVSHRVSVLKQARSFRSDIRWRTIGSTFWTAGLSRCRRVLSASCTSRARSGARLSEPGVADGGAVCRRSERAAGARMYRTGDLARWRADGVLEFWAGPTRR